MSPKYSSNQGAIGTQSSRPPGALSCREFRRRRGEAFRLPEIGERSDVKAAVRSSWRRSGDSAALTLPWRWRTNRHDAAALRGSCDGAIPNDRAWRSKSPEGAEPVTLRRWRGQLRSRHRLGRPDFGINEGPRRSSTMWVGCVGRGCWHRRGSECERSSSDMALPAARAASHRVGWQLQRALWVHIVISVPWWSGSRSSRLRPGNLSAAAHSAAGAGTGSSRIAAIVPATESSDAAVSAAGTRGLERSSLHRGVRWRFRYRRALGVSHSCV